MVRGLRRCAVPTNREERTDGKRIGSFRRQLRVEVTGDGVDGWVTRVGNDGGIKCRAWGAREIILFISTSKRQLFGVVIVLLKALR